MYSPFTRSVKALVRSSINQPALRRNLLFIALALLVLALSSAARAVSPPPDGGYPNDNTAEGDGALLNLTSGTDNTAIGFQALQSNQIGVENTAVGSDALSKNTEFSNTAVGSAALSGNTTGDTNTAVGAEALVTSQTGSGNTAIGESALFNNLYGSSNTATGSEAIYFGNGSNNTADGWGAMGNSNTSSQASNNTAVGYQALAGTLADYNTAIGQGSLLRDSTGQNNTANGAAALSKNTVGSNNVAVGVNAGNNLTTGANNIDIGANVVGAAGEANTIRIGKQGTQKSTFVAGISGVAVSGKQVVVTSNGKLGIATSSARFKEAIKPMHTASEAILALKPVTFRYKEDIDPDKMPQFGLIAEEVAKVNPELVGRDEDGRVDTVRYEAVNAMLLNEFIKEHRRVDELAARLTEQQKEIKALKSELNNKTTKN